MRLLLYGILAAAAGAREIDVDASGCDSVRCLLERAARVNKGLARALEILEWDIVVVADGRRIGLEDRIGNWGKIAVLPPASGGSPGGSRVFGGILKPGDEVDIDEIIEKLTGPGVGAIAVFVGVVRSPNEGEEVEFLEYDYDPELTGKWLTRIAEEEVEKRGLYGAAAYHYVGRRYPRERTMIVAVAGDRRDRVFKALAELVDRIKHEAPIWKSEKRGGKLYYYVGSKAIDFDALKSRDS
ncbi:MAG: molybdenum cofactor biosynthesis protein MoaE [Desulfurococcales archaeon]|nr:molybdenum cofactor biosynthesis protein MoaE [Desulfurococcales archaeon]